MKKIYFFTLIIALLSLTALAQPNLVWAKQIGGSGSTNLPYSIAADNSGNVYTCGSFQGTMDFDPSASTFTMASAGSMDVYVTKFDPNGNFVWAKQIGAGSSDDGYGITVEGSGSNVYITGDFSGTVDFDPGAASFTMAAQNVDAFVAKLDGSGNFVWARQLAGPGNETGWGITIDNNFNVYTCGQFDVTIDLDPGAATSSSTTAGAGDIYVSKLTSGGNLFWGRTMGGTSNDVAYSIALDIGGNPHIAGSFMGTCDFDPSASTANLTSAGNNDIFVCKLTSAGAYSWASRMGGTVNDNGISLRVDASGNVYTTGSFNGVADFDPGASTANLTTFGMSDIYVSKLDNTGAYVWAKQFGGTNVDGGNGIRLDASGNVYTTGYFGGTADFDPSGSVFNMVSAGFQDIFISQLDGSGNFGWAVRMGSANGDYGAAITIDNNSSILTTGNFQGTVDFDPNSGTFNMTSSSSPQDIYVQKLATCTVTPAQPAAISGATLVCPGSTNTYSIAAVSGASGYSWMMPAGWTGSSSTNSIGATAGSTGIFSVSATNSCGASPVQTLAVTVGTIPTVTTTGNSSINGSGSNPVLCSNIPSTVTLNAGGANSYTWNPGGTAAPTITLTNTTTTITTTFTVTGTNTAGCTSTSTITVMVTICSGLAELQASGSTFKVYPNPTNGKINIEAAEGNIEVYNLIGEKLFERKSGMGLLELDMRGLPNGMYLIKLDASGKVQTTRVILDKN